MRSFALLNALGHWLHTKGRTLECILWCFFKSPFSKKHLSHSLQLKFFWFEWYFWCFFRPLASINFFSQLSQENNLSKVWINSCLFKFPFSLKDFPHCLQKKDIFERDHKFVPIRTTSQLKLVFWVNLLLFNKPGQICSKCKILNTDNTKIKFRQNRQSKDYFWQPDPFTYYW